MYENLIRKLQNAAGGPEGLKKGEIEIEKNKSLL